MTNSSAATAAMDSQVEDAKRQLTDVEADGRIGLIFFVGIVAYCAGLLGISAALAAVF